MEVKEFSSLIGHFRNNRHNRIVINGFLFHAVIYVGCTNHLSLQFCVIVGKLLYKRNTSIRKHTSITAIKITISLNLSKCVCKSFNRHTYGRCHVSQTSCGIYNIPCCNIVCSKLFCCCRKFNKRIRRHKSHLRQFVEYLRSAFCAIDKNTKRTFVHFILRTNLNKILDKLRACANRKVECQTVFHIVPRTTKSVVALNHLTIFAHQIVVILFQTINPCIDLLHFFHRLWVFYIKTHFIRCELTHFISNIVKCFFGKTKSTF